MCVGGERGRATAAAGALSMRGALGGPHILRLERVAQGVDDLALVRDVVHRLGPAECSGDRAQAGGGWRAGAGLAVTHYFSTHGRRSLAPLALLAMALYLRRAGGRA